MTDQCDGLDRGAVARLREYRVVLTEQTRHGHAKRHTFVVGFDGQWATEPDVPKLIDRSMRAGFGTSGQPSDLDRLGMLRKPLSAKVNLSAGFSVSGATLAAILDALALGRRQRADLSDLKRVVSQLGPRLAALSDLDDDTWRLAAPALYSEVVTRCTTV